MLQARAPFARLGGIMTNATDAWTTQQARNLLLHLSQRIRVKTHDGARQYSRSVDDVFHAIGARTVTTQPLPPQRAPHASAFAERWVRSVRHGFCERTPHLEPA